MEAFFPGMEEGKKLEEAKLTSAAAFLEGGIQEACDDACSICLEEFCENDPSTVTGCKHEFHLQCILEWCQRSSQCPMCWQPISLKDPTSQELLDAVVQERNLRLNAPRNAAIFHHPAVGDFELPLGVNDAELEERIIQHMAAAAAMGRARHYARREGHRARSSTQGRQRFLVFSSNPSSQAGASSPEGGLGETYPTSSIAMPSPPVRNGGEASPSTSSPNRTNQRDLVSASKNSALATIGHSQASPCNYGMSSSQSSPRSQDSAGPSDLHSFSETLKSRLNTMSMRYKESISKSTRGWKERWFSRNSTMSDIGSEVHREMNGGLATVSRMMERLETRDSERIGNDSSLISSESIPAPDSNNQRRVNSIIEPGGNPLNDNRRQAPCATQSGSD